jgi:hypothetical protein
MFTTIIWPLVIHWLILFVACYIITEYAQNYLYDETTPAVGLKVGAASLIFSAMLLWTKTSFDTMLTSEVAKTVLQGIVWFVVFLFILRFHPLHAFSIGVVSMLILAGLATLASDSLLRPASQGTPRKIEPSKPVRTSVGHPKMPLPPPAEKPAETPAPKQ